MKSIIQEERLSDLIKSSLNLMCKTSLSYDTEVEIKGLLGITLDKRNVFLVDIKEIITSGDYSEDEVEVEVEQEYETTPTKPSPVNKKADGASTRSTRAAKRSKRTIKEKPSVEPKKRKYATGAQAQQRSALLYSMAASGVANGDSRENADFSLSKVKEEDHEGQRSLDIGSAVDPTSEPDYNDLAVNNEDDVEDNAHDGDNVIDNNDEVPDNDDDADDDDESTDVEENTADLDFIPNIVNNKDEERFTQLNTPPTVSTSTDATGTSQISMEGHNDAINLPFESGDLAFNVMNDESLALLHDDKELPDDEDPDPTDENEDKTSGTIKDNKTYPCKECNQVFSRPYNLKRHMMKHTGQHIKCEICNKKCYSMWELNKHIEISHVQALRCDLCDKTYKSVEGLRRHNLAVHVMTFKYECHICSKGFQQEAHLENHLNTIHLNTKKYHCKGDNCFQSYSTRKELHAHRKEVHPDDPSLLAMRNSRSEDGKRNDIKQFSCRNCGKTYQWPSSLAYHSSVCKVQQTIIQEQF